MTDATAQKKPQPVSATPKPVKKRIPWTLTLKIEGDVVKVPEFKKTDWADVTAPIDLEVTIGKANQYIANESVVDLSTAYPTDKNRIVVLVLKLDPTTPKEAKALRVSAETQDQDAAEPGVQPKKTVPYRELGMDASKATLVYFADVNEVAVPKEGKLYIVNENSFEMKVAISLVYGPKMT